MTIARARAADAWVSTGVGCRRRRRGPVIAAIRPAGTTSSAAEHDGRQRRDLRLELELVQALLEPRLQGVGALAGLLRVEPGVGLAGLLLEL